MNPLDIESLTCVVKKKKSSGLGGGWLASKHKGDSGDHTPREWREGYWSAERDAIAIP